MSLNALIDRLATVAIADPQFMIFYVDHENDDHDMTDLLTPTEVFESLIAAFAYRHLADLRLFDLSELRDYLANADVNADPYATATPIYVQHYNTLVDTHCGKLWLRPDDDIDDQDVWILISRVS